MNLGILGGTFDPIHYAHLFIAEEARVRFDLDRVVFVVNALPPHKQTYPVTNASHRFRMTELAIASNPAFECSRIEIDRPGPSYTVDTLTELQRQHPSADLFFITGLDTLLELPTWHRPDEVIRLARFIVAERPGYAWDPGEQDLPSELIDRVLPLSTTHLEISSTDIRRRVRVGLPIRYLTPDSVTDYVSLHGLYSNHKESPGQSVKR
jgi:nicotinate-nucleotide adenylyltransferase